MSEKKRTDEGLIVPGGQYGEFAFSSRADLEKAIHYLRDKNTILARQLEEANAEVERLRRLVKDGYLEGASDFAQKWEEHDDVPVYWLGSDTRKRLEGGK